MCSCPAPASLSDLGTLVRLRQRFLDPDAGGKTTASISNYLRHRFPLHLHDAKMRVEQAAEQIVWKRNACDRIVPHDNAGSWLARVIIRNGVTQLCFTRIDESMF